MSIVKLKNIDDKRSQIYIKLNKLLFKENSHLSKNSAIKGAWSTLKEYILPNADKLKILSSHPGHFVIQGCNTGSLKNPHWLVEDAEKIQYYMMYVNNQTYTMFAKEDYKEIINPDKDSFCSWNFHKIIGYVATKCYPDKNNTMHYLHTIICSKYDKKNSTNTDLSVDHINRNKLDNRFNNLRFATQSEQNQNQDKRRRQKTAKDLPADIKQSDLPKFVVYYSEKYGPNKEHSREWFNIEKHPNLIKKRWSTTKSNKITIINKLQSVKSKIEELDKLTKIN